MPQDLEEHLSGSSEYLVSYIFRDYVKGVVKGDISIVT